MITEEKHREIAKELRSQARAWRNILPDICMSDRQLTDSIHMAFGLKDTEMPVHEALDMLADLIDRPTTTVYVDKNLLTRCTNCGYEIHLFIGAVMNYCPNCGELIIGECCQG